MKKQLIRNIGSLTVVTAISAMILTGCQETDYPTPQPSTTGFLTTARTLIVNASNATGITAFIENVAAGSTLAPGANTGYVATPVSASNGVRIKGSGGTLGTADLTAKSTFLANTAYTFFVTDSISRPLTRNAATGAVTDAGGIRFLTVTDTLTAPAAGTAKVRFFNLTPDVSAASARLTSVANTTAVTNLTNRPYRTATGTTLRYTTLPAGAYVTSVYSGTSIVATATPVASTTLTLVDGKIYTIFSQGINRTRTASVGTVLHN